MPVAMLFLLLAALYLFAIAPRLSGRPDPGALLGRHYAHRGLHDNSSPAPENSMAAFRRAVDAGYGIELDVQLTRDRVPVVFHDETLDRVCGVSGAVRDYTFEQLQAFPLLRSQERIPRFSDVLALVGGRIPLIVELKLHEHASAADVDALCTLADGLLSRYDGPYCIESFHPLAVLWYRRRRPQIIRGQLSCSFGGPGHRRAPGELIVQLLLSDFLTRPDFIAYDHQHKGCLSRVLCRRLFRALSVAWTIRSQAELDAARGDFDLFIFEGFIPAGR